MIERFNEETLSVVAEVCEKVAERLGVEEAHLCISTGTNADYDMDSPVAFSICFETPEDDTYAVLEYGRDPDEDLKTLLKWFLADPDVVWMKEGDELDFKPPTITFDYEEVEALHNVLNGNAHMVDSDVLNDVSVQLDIFVNEHYDADVD